MGNRVCPEVMVVSRWPWRIGVGQVLVEPVLHLRLVVVQVHLRRRADHVQVDGALRLGRKVRQARQARRSRACSRPPRRAWSPAPPLPARERRARRTAVAFRPAPASLFRSVNHFSNTSSRLNIWFATMVSAASSAGLASAAYRSFADGEQLLRLLRMRVVILEEVRAVRS